MWGGGNGEDIKAREEKAQVGRAVSSGTHQSIPNSKAEFSFIQQDRRTAEVTSRKNKPLWIIWF